MHNSCCSTDFDYVWRCPYLAQINHTATDRAGNMGFAVRTINVVDTLPPALTLLGSPLIVWEAATTYTV